MKIDIIRYTFLIRLRAILPMVNNCIFVIILILYFFKIEDYYLYLIIPGLSLLLLHNINYYFLTPFKKIGEIKLEVSGFCEMEFFHHGPRERRKIESIHFQLSTYKGKERWWDYPLFHQHKSDGSCNFLTINEDSWFQVLIGSKQQLADFKDLLNKFQQSGVEVIQKELSLFEAWKYHFISYTDQPYFQGKKMAWAAPQRFKFWI